MRGGSADVSKNGMPTRSSRSSPRAGPRASGGRRVRSTSRAPSGSSPVALGRSATRSSSTTSSPTRAAPALIVEMTSMPGCDGATSSGVIRGLSASRAPTGTATHSPGRAWVGCFAGVDSIELAHHLDEARARLRPGELVRVRVRVVLEPALQVGVVEQRVDRGRRARRDRGNRRAALVRRRAPPARAGTGSRRRPCRRRARSSSVPLVIWFGSR